MSRPIQLQPGLSTGTECSSWPLSGVEVYRELSLFWKASTEGAATQRPDLSFKSNSKNFTKY